MILSFSDSFYQYCSGYNMAGKDENKIKKRPEKPITNNEKDQQERPLNENDENYDKTNRNADITNKFLSQSFNLVRWAHGALWLAVTEHRWEDALKLLPTILQDRRFESDDILWRVTDVILRNNGKDSDSLFKHQIFQFFVKRLVKSHQLALDTLSHDLPVENESNIDTILEEKNVDNIPRLVDSCAESHMKAVSVGYEGLVYYIRWKNHRHTATLQNASQLQDNTISCSIKEEIDFFSQSSQDSITEKESLDRLAEKAYSTLKAAIQKIQEPCEWLMDPFLELVLELKNPEEAISTLQMYTMKYDHLPAQRLAYHFLKKNFPDSREHQMDVLETITAMCPQDALVFDYVKELLFEDNAENYPISDDENSISYIDTVKCLLKSDYYIQALMKCLNLLIDLVEFKRWTWQLRPWEALTEILSKFYLSWIRCWKCLLCSESRKLVKNIGQRIKPLWKLYIWSSPPSSLSLQQANVLYHRAFAAHVLCYNDAYLLDVDKVLLKGDFQALLRKLRKKLGSNCRFYKEFINFKRKKSKISHNGGGCFVEDELPDIIRHLQMNNLSEDSSDESTSDESDSDESTSSESRHSDIVQSATTKEVNPVESMSQKSRSSVSCTRQSQSSLESTLQQSDFLQGIGNLFFDAENCVTSTQVSHSPKAPLLANEQILISSSQVQDTSVMFPNTGNLSFDTQDLITSTQVQDRRVLPNRQCPQASDSFLILRNVDTPSGLIKQQMCEQITKLAKQKGQRLSFSNSPANQTGKRCSLSKSPSDNELSSEDELSESLLSFTLPANTKQNIKFLPSEKKTNANTSIVQPTENSSAKQRSNRGSSSSINSVCTIKSPKSDSSNSCGNAARATRQKKDLDMLVEEDNEYDPLAEYARAFNMSDDDDERDSQAKESRTFNPSSKRRDEIPVSPSRGVVTRTQTGSERDCIGRTKISSIHEFDDSISHSNQNKNYGNLSKSYSRFDGSGTKTKESAVSRDNRTQVKVSNAKPNTAKAVSKTSSVTGSSSSDSDDDISCGQKQHSGSEYKAWNSVQLGCSSPSSVESDGVACAPVIGSQSFVEESHLESKFVSFCSGKLIVPETQSQTLERRSITPVSSMPRPTSPSIREKCSNEKESERYHEQETSDDQESNAEDNSELCMENRHQESAIHIETAGDCQGEYVKDNTELSMEDFACSLTPGQKTLPRQYETDDNSQENNDKFNTHKILESVPVSLTACQDEIHHGINHREDVDSESSNSKQLTSLDHYPLGDPTSVKKVSHDSIAEESSDDDENYIGPSQVTDLSTSFKRNSVNSSFISINRLSENSVVSNSCDNDSDVTSVGSIYENLQGLKEESSRLDAVNSCQGSELTRDKMKVASLCSKNLSQDIVSEKESEALFSNTIQNENTNATNINDSKMGMKHVEDIAETSFRSGEAESAATNDSVLLGNTQNKVDISNIKTEECDEETDIDLSLVSTQNNLSKTETELGNADSLFSKVIENIDETVKRQERESHIDIIKHEIQESDSHNQESTFLESSSLTCEPEDEYSDINQPSHAINRKVKLENVVVKKERVRDIGEKRQEMSINSEGRNSEVESVKFPADYKISEENQKKTSGVKSSNKSLIHLSTNDEDTTTVEKAEKSCSSEDDFGVKFDALVAEDKASMISNEDERDQQQSVYSSDLKSVCSDGTKQSLIVCDKEENKVTEEMEFFNMKSGKRSRKKSDIIDTEMNLHKNYTLCDKTKFPDTIDRVHSGKNEESEKIITETTSESNVNFNGLDSKAPKLLHDVNDSESSKQIISSVGTVANDSVDKNMKEYQETALDGNSRAAEKEEIPQQKYKKMYKMLKSEKLTKLTSNHNEQQSAELSTCSVNDKSDNSVQTVLQEASLDKRELTGKQIICKSRNTSVKPEMSVLKNDEALTSQKQRKKKKKIKDSLNVTLHNTCMKTNVSLLANENKLCPISYGNECRPKNIDLSLHDSKLHIKSNVKKKNGSQVNMAVNCKEKSLSPRPNRTNVYPFPEDKQNKKKEKKSELTFVHGKKECSETLVSLSHDVNHFNESELREIKKKKIKKNKTGLEKTVPKNDKENKSSILAVDRNLCPIPVYEEKETGKEEKINSITNDKECMGEIVSLSRDTKLHNVSSAKKKKKKRNANCIIASPGNCKGNDRSIYTIENTCSLISDDKKKKKERESSTIGFTTDKKDKVYNFVSYCREDSPSSKSQTAEMANVEPNLPGRSCNTKDLSIHANEKDVRRKKKVNSGEKKNISVTESFTEEKDRSAVSLPKKYKKRNLSLSANEESFCSGTDGSVEKIIKDSKKRKIISLNNKEGKLESENLSHESKPHNLSSTHNMSESKKKKKKKKKKEICLKMTSTESCMANQTDYYPIPNDVKERKKAKAGEVSQKSFASGRESSSTLSLSATPAKNSLLVKEKKKSQKNNAEERPKANETEYCPIPNDGKKKKKVKIGQLSQRAFASGEENSSTLSFSATPTKNSVSVKEKKKSKKNKLKVMAKEKANSPSNVSLSDETDISDGLGVHARESGKSDDNLSTVIDTTCRHNEDKLKQEKKKAKKIKNKPEEGQMTTTPLNACNTTESSKKRKLKACQLQKENAELESSASLSFNADLHNELNKNKKKKLKKQKIKFGEEMDISKRDWSKSATNSSVEGKPTESAAQSVVASNSLRINNSKLCNEMLTKKHCGTSPSVKSCQKGERPREKRKSEELQESVSSPSGVHGFLHKRKKHKVSQVLCTEQNTSKMSEVNNEAINVTGTELLKKENYMSKMSKSTNIEISTPANKSEIRLKNSMQKKIAKKNRTNKDSLATFKGDASNQKDGKSCKDSKAVTFKEHNTTKDWTLCHKQVIGDIIANKKQKLIKTPKNKKNVSKQLTPPWKHHVKSSAKSHKLYNLDSSGLL